MIKKIVDEAVVKGYDSYNGEKKDVLVTRTRVYFLGILLYKHIGIPNY